MIVRAPAKVNLVLRVGPLREDGYHRLATLFQAIDLLDELELEPAAETTVEGFDDTLVTAALAALGETRRVRLTKRIPVAAGLGGGSSDAAAVLRALRGERDVNELYAIARDLGRRRAVLPERVRDGDRLRPRRPDRAAPSTFPAATPSCCCPPSRASPPPRCSRAGEPNEIFPAVRGRPVRAVHTTRTPAEDVAALLVERPRAGGARAATGAGRRAGRAAARRGRCGVAVSGSGPTVFGVFQDRRAAERLRWRSRGDRGLPSMIPGMAKWNISSDAITVEQSPGRSPSRWLRQNGLKIAVVVGLIEAVVAYVTGHALLMTVIGIVSVIVYLNVRHRLPVRDPAAAVDRGHGPGDRRAAAACDHRRVLHRLRSWRSGC